MINDCEDMFLFGIRIDLRVWYTTVKLISFASMVDISQKTYSLLIERDVIKEKSAET